MKTRLRPLRGVFLCAASRGFASAARPLRSPRGPGAAASGNSNPCVAAGARRPTGRRSRRTRGGSVRRPAATSTATWRSPPSRRPPAAVAPGVAAGRPRVSASRRGAAGRRYRPRRGVDSASSIATRPNGSRPPGGPRRRDAALGSTVRWPVADGPPTPAAILAVSCTMNRRIRRGVVSDSSVNNGNGHPTRVGSCEDSCSSGSRPVPITMPRIARAQRPQRRTVRETQTTHPRKSPRGFHPPRCC